MNRGCPIRPRPFCSLEHLGTLFGLWRDMVIHGATYDLFWRIANSTNLSVLSKRSLLVIRGRRAWTQGSYQRAQSPSSMISQLRLQPTTIPPTRCSVHAKTTSSKKLRSLRGVTDNIWQHVVGGKSNHPPKTANLRITVIQSVGQRQPAWTTRPAKPKQMTATDGPKLSDDIQRRSRPFS